MIKQLRDKVVMGGWIRQLAIRRPVPMRYFQSPHRMRALLCTEQQRAIRSGLPFAFATVRPQNKNELDDYLWILESACERRLRVIDVAGLWEKSTVAILLPYTNASGARIVLDDLRDLVAGQIDGLQWDVFEYPAQPIHSEGEYAPIDDVESPQEAKLFCRLGGYTKKAIDVCIASIAIVALLPLVVASALAIKITSPGPIFFCQLREGRHGRTFQLWKLRTMHDAAELQKEDLRPFSEQDGPAFKLTNDPRITRVGKFLRYSSIDEIPQFWNVLRGEMSLVGPRPLPVSESRSCTPWQRRRLSVKPGITCSWQVFGRSRVSFDEWIRMDLRYIESRSLATDLRLLLLTIPAVLSGRGAK